MTRTAHPDSAHVGSLVTRMGYDPAGRKVVDTATDNATETYEYDADGHVIVHNTRNGGIVAWSYDALGQLMNRQIGATIAPAITFDPRFLQWAPRDFATQKADVSIFTYDSAGRMLSADNPVAQIRRTYMPNGALLTDTLRIATWAQDSDYARHIYVLTHTYDLDGRWVATRGVGGDSVAYDLAGRVTGIQDAGRLWFTYHYDALGRPDVITYPNGAQLTNTYDVQNQLRRRHEIGPSPSDSLIHDDTLSYDARGKVLYATGHTEIDYEGYSALGTLWASMRHNTALGPALRNDERYGADAMGNVAQRTVVRTTGGEDSTFSFFTAGTGRLLAQHSLNSTDSTIYTTGGDRAVTWSQPKFAHGGDESRYYYRDDGLLVAVDHRACVTADSCIPNGLDQPTSLTGAFEDYRYDALGRRVQVRTRMDSICEGASCNSSLMWVVWDGNAIAAEIRGAGGDGIAVDSLEEGSGHGPFYGTVDYLNGPNMDEPLEIQGIQVYRTWRGLIDGGQCLTGECGTGTIDYPGLTYESYLSLIPSTQSAPTSWHGTLFAEGQDDGGLMYRRNRYYDPNTGQFTQEDPLGLAGGLNAYGFAGGDPVNFSDPFGLCPDPKDPVCSWAVHGAYGTTPGVPLLGLGGIGAKVEAYWNKHKDAILQSAAKLLTDGMSAAGDGWEGLSPADLRGKSPTEIDKMVPNGWARSNSKAAEGGQGTRYAHPTNRGEQIRIMPGDPNAPTGVKQGPYAGISRGGKVSDPIPLAGNPTLPPNERP